jgi:hypothetical protein
MWMATAVLALLALRKEPAPPRARASRGGAAPAIAPYAPVVPAVAAVPVSRAAEAAHVPSRRYLLPVCTGLAVAVFAFSLVRLNTVEAISAQDEGALLYGAHQLLETGSVRVENDLARQYGSPVIGNLYVSYRGEQEGYYRAFPGMVLLDAALISIGGDGFFWTSNALFSMAAVVAAFILTWRLTRSTLAATFAGVLLATSPVFLHWGTSYFNNVPVVAAELAAFACVVGSHVRRRDMILGGFFMGLALFLRTTEVFTALLLVGFIAARERNIRPVLVVAMPIVFMGAGLMCVNMWLYGHAAYQPHVAPTFPGLAGAATEGPSVLERQLMFLVGAKGSLGEADLTALPGNYLFHLRYFLGSSFAFPLLIPVLAAIVVGVARGWRELRPLLAIAFAIVVLTTLLYGNQESNYYGYGENLVRNSFVRYLLLAYAMLAVMAGVALARTMRNVRLGAASTILVPVGTFAAIVGVGAVSVSQANDWDRYGLSRLNLYRDVSRTQQEQLNAVMAPHRAEAPLVLAGFTTGKLIDLDDYPNVIDYSELPQQYREAEMPSLLERALEDRPVFLVGSTATDDQSFVEFLREHGFALEEHKLEYDFVYRVRMEG